MQAKESLNFVEPFTPGEAINPTEAQRHETEQHFFQLCLGLLQKFPDNVRSCEILEESGFITVFESSLTLAFSDASHLHVLLFGYSNEGGYLDFYIALEEHDDSGLSTDGYMYRYNAAGLIRTNAPRDDGELDEGDDPHLSIIDMYGTLGELSDMEASADEEVSEYAKDIRAGFEEGAAIERWECELGYDGQAPSQAELDQLTEILALVSPRSDQR